MTLLSPTSPLIVGSPIIVLGLNNNQSVNSTSFTDIDFNTEPDSITHADFTHSTSTNPEQVVVNTTGLYKINGFISIQESTTTNIRYVGEGAVAVDGTYRDGIHSGYIRFVGGADQSCIVVYDVIPLTASQVLKVGIRRLSSTSGVPVTSANKTKITIERIA